MVSERNVVALVENNLSYAQRLELRSKLGQVRYIRYIRYIRCIRYIRLVR